MSSTASKQLRYQWASGLSLWETPRGWMIQHEGKLLKRGVYWPDAWKFLTQISAGDIRTEVER